MLSQTQTLRAIERRPEFAGLLKEHQPFSQGTAAGPSESVNGWFDTLMVQSGIRSSPAMWLGLSVVTGLTLGGMAFVLSEQLFPSIFSAVVGLFIPVLIAVVQRFRRQSAIMQQLPAMAEEMARAARSGRNVEKAFHTVAGDTASPLGDELRTSARRVEMGLDLASAIEDLPYRTGVSTLTIFTSAVAVHQDTGGDLISVLERLATSVRDRLHFVARMRAATIASRLGTVMMMVVPVLVISFYLFRDPLYLDRLMSSFWGRLSLWMALLLQITGCVSVLRILSRSSRF